MLIGHGRGHYILVMLENYVGLLCELDKPNRMFLTHKCDAVGISQGFSVAS